MYAIFEDSGTQILVRKDDEIQIDLRPLTEGQKTITFEKVLAIGAGDGQPAKIGLPYLAGATVTAEIVGAVDMAAVRAACRAELARPEVPVTIRLVESLPLSAAQKLVRAEAA